MIKYHTTNGHAPKGNPIVATRRLTVLKIFLVTSSNTPPTSHTPNKKKMLVGDGARVFNSRHIRRTQRKHKPGRVGKNYPSVLSGRGGSLPKKREKHKIATIFIHQSTDGIR